MYLSVPIPERNASGIKGGPVYLDDCLRKFMEEEILDGDDACNCSRCKTRRRAKKVLSIAKLPTILLIHLKRFYYQGPFKNKIETYVDYPINNLDLTRYMPAYQVYPDGNQGRRRDYVYDLYAVSVTWSSIFCSFLRIDERISF